MTNVEVIGTTEAMEILGYSRPAVCRLCSNGTIKSAFRGYSDGHYGNPGWRMHRDEIVNIANSHKKRKRWKNAVIEQKVETKPAPEPSNEKPDVKKTLNDLHICLILLADCLAKLKEEL